MCRGSPRHWLERLRCGTIIDLDGNFFDDYSKGSIRAPGVDVNRQLSPSSTAPSNAVTLSTYLNLMYCDYVRIGTTSIRTSKSKRLLRCTVLTFCAQKIRLSFECSDRLAAIQGNREAGFPDILSDAKARQAYPRSCSSLRPSLRAGRRAQNARARMYQDSVPR